VGGPLMAEGDHLWWCNLFGGTSCSAVNSLGGLSVVATIGPGGPILGGTSCNMAGPGCVPAYLLQVQYLQIFLLYHSVNYFNFPSLLELYPGTGVTAS